MTKWWDIVAAILVARVIYILFFIPTLGPFLSYCVYELWVVLYCQWRKNMLSV